MEKQLFTVACKYCGQLAEIMAFDETDAREKVSEDCECGGADEDKKRKALNSYLEQLCGLNADGFLPVPHEVFQTLKHAIELAINRQIDKVTFNVDGTTITIIAGSEKIKINRKKTESKGGEI